MTLSDRSVIFLVAALLASATLGTAGIVEQNGVFRQKIFEFRAQQLANDIDAMMYTDEGQLQKRLTSQTDLSVISEGGGKKITVDRNNLESVDVPLDSDPSSVSLEDIEYMCVTKLDGIYQTPAELVDVEGGQC